MIVVVLRRLAAMVGVIFCVSVLTFVIFEVAPTGDPAVRIAGKLATPDNIALVRKNWGLDKPVTTQYWVMMKKLLITRNLVSYQNQANVFQQIAQDAPRTLSLAIGAAALWFIMGVVLAVVSFAYSGQLVDRALGFLGIVGISTPVFWLAAVCLYVFTLRWGRVSAFHWIPAGGYVPLSSSPLGWAQHLLLPWLVLAFTLAGYYARLLRSGLEEVAQLDFVYAARGKGISEWRVVTKHVLRNAVLPIVALLGMDFSAVLAGASILVEPLFGLGGLGQYAQESISSLDFPPLMALTFFGATSVVIVSALADLAQRLLDPRLRSS